MKGLSIIICVYNGMRDNMLEFCLESILHQTMDDYEIVVVDDDSTDGSYEKSREYEAKYPEKIRVFRQDVNHKPGGARNRGIREAKGKYVGFVDADDWIDKTMYEKLYTLALEKDADVVCCDYYKSHKRNYDVGEYVSGVKVESNGKLSREQYKRLILNAGPIWCKIYKRDIIIKNSLWFPEDVFFEDNNTSVRWMLHMKNLYKIPEGLYYYFQNPTSIVHLISKKHIQDRLLTATLLVKETKKDGDYEKYKDEVDFRFLELFYIITINMLIYNDVEGFDVKMLLEMKRRVHELVPQYRRNKYWNTVSRNNRIKLFLNEVSPFILYSFIRIKKIQIKRIKRKKISLCHGFSRE